MSTRTHKRNADFVNDVRELTQKGYTQDQIIERLKKKFGYNSISRKTISRSLYIGAIKK